MNSDTRLLYHRLLGSLLLAFGFLSIMLVIPYGIIVAGVVFFVLSHKQFVKVAELQKDAQKGEEPEMWLPPGVRRPPAAKEDGP